MSLEPAKSLETMPSINNQSHEEGTVQCICGNKENFGVMVQCEGCSIWQHCKCINFDPKTIPGSYFCKTCLNSNNKHLPPEFPSIDLNNETNIPNNAAEVAISSDMLTRNKKVSPPTVSPTLKPDIKKDAKNTTQNRETSRKQHTLSSKTSRSRDSNTTKPSTKLVNASKVNASKVNASKANASKVNASKANASKANTSKAKTNASKVNVSKPASRSGVRSSSRKVRTVAKSTPASETNSLQQTNTLATTTKVPTTAHPRKRTSVASTSVKLSQQKAAQQKSTPKLPQHRPASQNSKPFAPNMLTNDIFTPQLDLNSLELLTNASNKDERLLNSTFPLPSSKIRQPKFSYTIPESLVKVQTHPENKSLSEMLRRVKKLSAHIICLQILLFPDEDVSTASNNSTCPTNAENTGVNASTRADAGVDAAVNAAVNAKTSSKTEEDRQVKKAKILAETLYTLDYPNSTFKCGRLSTTQRQNLKSLGLACNIDDVEDKLDPKSQNSDLCHILNLSSDSSSDCSQDYYFDSDSDSSVNLNNWKPDLTFSKRKILELRKKNQHPSSPLDTSDTSFDILLRLNMYIADFQQRFDKDYNKDGRRTSNT